MLQVQNHILTYYIPADDKRLEFALPGTESMSRQRSRTPNVRSRSGTVEPLSAVPRRLGAANTPRAPSASRSPSTSTSTNVQATGSYPDWTFPANFADDDDLMLEHDKEPSDVEFVGGDSEESSDSDSEVPSKKANPTNVLFGPQPRPSWDNGEPLTIVERKKLESLPSDYEREKEMGIQRRDRALRELGVDQAARDVTEYMKGKEKVQGKGKGKATKPKSKAAVEDNGERRRSSRL